MMMTRRARCATRLRTASTVSTICSTISALGLARLGEQREVGADRDRRRHREVAAVAAHDLDDERAVVRGRGVGDLVARLDDRVHRGVDADRQPGQAEVVVDRRRDADHRERLAAPISLGSASVQRAGQRAVAADHDQAVDRRGCASIARARSRTSRWWNSLQRAEPRIVPPSRRMPATSAGAERRRTRRRAGRDSRARSRGSRRPRRGRPGSPRGSPRSCREHRRRSSGSRSACMAMPSLHVGRASQRNCECADVRVERDGPVTTVILDRAGREERGRSRHRRGARRRVPRVRRRPRRARRVLYGDHGTFCAGADLKALAAGSAEPRRARRRRPDGAVAHAARQAGDRRDRGPRGRRRPRARAVVRPARRRGRRGARRVLPPLRRAADRRRHDPAAAADRPVARARSDPDRPRGRTPTRRSRSASSTASCRAARRARPPSSSRTSSPRCRRPRCAPIA